MTYYWRLSVKYDPDQPRVPAGRPEGGRWTTWAAARLRREAEAKEPGLTAAVTGAVAAAGGEMWGLRYRLKTQASLDRKIKAEAAEEGIPPGEVVIKDAVRYTVLFGPEGYAEGFAAVRRELARRGWTKYDHQFKNYWEPGDAYDGYNCVFQSPDGFLMEFQFHTPQSIQVKEKSHKLYEKARTMGAGPERQKLIQGMKDLWSSVTRPPGWEQLPGRLMVSGGT